MDQLTFWENVCRHIIRVIPFPLVLSRDGIAIDRAICHCIVDISVQEIDLYRQNNLCRCNTRMDSQTDYNERQLKKSEKRNEREMSIGKKREQKPIMSRWTRWMDMLPASLIVAVSMMDKFCQHNLNDRSSAKRATARSANYDWWGYWPRHRSHNVPSCCTTRAILLESREAWFHGFRRSPRNETVCSFTAVPLPRQRSTRYRCCRRECRIFHSRTLVAMYHFSPPQKRKI